MSHLVSENKSIYFLTCFAQMKITLFIFVNKWVIWENESFLLVELCSHVPKSRGDGEVSCFFVSFFFFLRLTNDYSRLSSIYPSLALSDFHLPCRFESPSDTPLYAVSEAPPDCKLCSPQFLQSRFTACKTLIKSSPILLYEIGLFVYLFIYLFILCES